MKMRTPIAALALLLGAVAAQAHVKLTGSAPADKSRGPAPTALVLHFSEGAYLTGLTLQHGTEKPVALPLPAAGVAAADISVPLPALADGAYVLSWKAESDDTHTSTGKIAFTVDSKATPHAMHHAGTTQ